MDGMFLAYAHSDRGVALPIAQALRAAGLVMADFYDPRPLSFNFDDSLKPLLDASSHLLLLWSANARRSHWLEYEWRYFLQSPQGRILVLAIDDTPLPPELNQFQILRYSPDPNDSHPHMHPILRALDGVVLKVDQKKVFISYSRQDSAAVRDVLSEISQCPLRPYMDVEFVRDEERFARDIILALRDSVDLCFMSSAASNNSRHCDREVMLADKFAKPLALVHLDQHSLSEENTYFFATVPPRPPGTDLCRYLLGQINRKKGAAPSG
jgi:hypothetical protein